MVVQIAVNVLTELVIVILDRRVKIVQKLHVQKIATMIMAPVPKATALVFHSTAAIPVACCVALKIVPIMDIVMMMENVNVIPIGWVMDVIL